MLVERNRAVIELLEIKIVDMRGWGSHLDIQHLIEIAIVDITVPTYRQRIAAHQAVDRGGVEGVYEFLHVFGVIARIQQILEEPADGHIGHSVQIIEIDAVAAFELALKLGFEHRLTGGQEGARGVIHQVEYESAAFEAVAYCIQHLQGAYAIFKDPLAPLGVGAAFAEIGQRRYQVYLIGSKKGRQVVVFRVSYNDRKIAAVHHLFAPLAAFFHKPAKMWVHLGRPAGDVYCGNVIATHNLQAAFQQLAAHQLFAVGAGVNVAMSAALVAELADIYLKNIQSPGLQRVAAQLCQPVRKRGQVDIFQLLAVEHLQLKKRIRKLLSS